MKQWNFHTNIAIPMEQYGRAYFGNAGRTADEIECGEFVDSMLSVLSMKYGSLDCFGNFVDQCREYEDLPASKIPRDRAKNIFLEFEKLINKQ